MDGFDPWLKAAELASVIYALLRTAAEDIAYHESKKKKSKKKEHDFDRYFQVHFQGIHKNAQAVASLYYREFDAMRTELKEANPIDLTPFVAQRLKARIDSSWLHKNTVREEAKAWLESLPKGSQERAYVWSVCNLFYMRTPANASAERLLRDADNIADSAKDAVLDTPNTRIADMIRSGEISTREQILDVLESEISGLIGGLKLCEAAYQRLRLARHHLESD